MHSVICGERRKNDSKESNETVLPSLQADFTCPEGWVDATEQEEGSCFLLSTSSMNYTEGLNVCSRVIN